MSPAPEKGFINKSRLENLSDAIFAIILTLLIIEFRVPHLEHPASPEELGQALMGMVPHLLSWLNSFFTIIVIWLNHHRFFQMFRTVDHGLFWWNSLLMLWVALIPFPTAMMGELIDNPLAVSLYGGLMFLQALTWMGGRLYLLHHLHLFHDHVSIEAFRQGTWATLVFGPLAYGTAAGLAWVHPYLGLAIYLLIALYFILPHSTRDE